jgi:hypothetical protein
VNQQLIQGIHHSTTVLLKGTATKCWLPNISPRVHLSHLSLSLTHTHIHTHTLTGHSIIWGLSIWSHAYGGTEYPDVTTRTLPPYEPQHVASILVKQLGLALGTPSPLSGSQSKRSLKA